MNASLLPLLRRHGRDILASPGMRLQIDGEIVPMDEAEFAVHPGGLLIHA